MSVLAVRISASTTLLLGGLLMLVAGSANAQADPTSDPCGRVCLLQEACTTVVDGEPFAGRCSILCQCIPDHPLPPTATPTPSPTPTASPPVTNTAPPTPSAPATATPAPTGTPTRTPTPAPTVNPTYAACVGNCDAGPDVTVDELIRGVRISLGTLPLSACPAFDLNHSGNVTIPELIQAVVNAINGCGVWPPTPRPTWTRSPTTTPTPTPSRSPTITPTPTESGTPTATFTRSPTRTATFTPRPTVTRTGTRTQTPTRTGTRTRTPAGIDSVCGGFVNSIPKLCNIDVTPNPVPLFGNFRVRFCLSDLDGDVNQFCMGIQTSPAAPDLVCQSFSGGTGTFNRCTQTGLIAFTNPAGEYVLHAQVRDRAGHRSAVATAPFPVR